MPWSRQVIVIRPRETLSELAAAARTALLKAGNNYQIAAVSPAGDGLMVFLQREDNTLKARDKVGDPDSSGNTEIIEH